MIEYAGNSTTSQSPFAQIVFNYKNRADVTTYTYGGKEFTRNILLDNIEVKSNGQTFKKYGLTYMRDSYAQLLKVTESSCQNASLNPIVFAWTDQTEQFTQSSNYANSDYEMYFSGDFNGDGRSDLVAVPIKETYSSSDKWKLYLADADGNLNYTNQGDLNSTFETFLVGDFNGDGLTDLMMQQTTSNDYAKYYYLYSSTGTNFTRSTSYYLCDDIRYMDVLDYNGDGILEFLYHVSNGTWTLYTYSGSTILSGSNIDFKKFYMRNPGLPLDDVLDFNGDGCSDLLVLSSTGYAVYEFKGTNHTLIQTYSGTNINNSHKLLFGDFNGDGTTDIIKFDNQSLQWNLLNLTSGGFQSHGLSNLNYSFDFFANNEICARDMDGDGKTDIFMYGHGTNGSNSYNRINIALSSNNFSLTENVSSGTLYCEQGIVIDFNGDGRDEMFFKNGNNSTYFSFASGTPSHLIKTIIDGVGAKTALTYLPMSNSSVYSRGTGASFPVSDYSSSMQLVSQVSGDNGIGGTNSMTYQYTGAKIHREGKGFLCFSKISTTNNAAGIITDTESGYNDTYYYPKVNTITKKTTGNITIETTSNTWTQTVLDANTKRIFPYIQSTTQSNSLTGFSVSNTISSFDSYGNPTQFVKDYGNGVTETTVNDYSGTINTTDWLLGRIGSSAITYAKSGETSVNKTIRYTYAADGIVKPDYIYYYEGTGLEFYKNHDYDSKGNLTQIYTSGSSIGSSQINYTYNSIGTKVLTATDALGHVTTNTYDTYGKLLTGTDWLNNTITHQYDEYDRPYTVSSSNGSSNATTYIWTGSNKPAYGVYGITQTGNDGSLSAIWYDIPGRAIRSEKKGFDGTMILSDTEYNTKGQVYRVSEPYFAGGNSVWAETFTYDDYGRTSAIN
ncbi:MAG: FG-GAP-like repeat-containing protein, partial [Bacteroidota bacterium]